jgi:glycosyltransferase involved in cell wall biosynthesis
VIHASLYDFTIIVPTRNRPDQLARCLDSIAALSYPPERFEVIVVNDGGDATNEKAVRSRLDAVHFTLLHKSHAGPGLARNHGAARARGRFLAFTDDDCTVAPGWLSAFKAHFDRAPTDLAGGKWINALTANVYSAACHTIVDAAFEYYDPACGRAHFFPSSNFAMAAATFRDLGGFAPRWTLVAAEDREFCFRWLHHGFPMARVPDAVVFHHHAHTLTSYCRLHFRYGQGAYRYHEARKSAGAANGLQPAWAFYRACFRHPFAHFAASRAAAVSALLIVWQVANAAGYFRERAKQRGGKIAGP